MLAPGRRLDLDERPFRHAVTRRCAESDVAAAQQGGFSGVLCGCLRLRFKRPLNSARNVPQSGALVPVQRKARQGFGLIAMPRSRVIDECRLAARYTGVSLIGFVVDVAVLHVLLGFAIAPAWARVVSLTVAMHVTFVINGRHVFQTLSWQSLPRQWWRYMVSNGLGNLCNYWIFVTMVSTHWPIVSLPIVALAVGSAAAWAINFAAARRFVFARARTAAEVLAERYARPE
jgi:putative flippase GtrA